VNGLRFISRWHAKSLKEGSPKCGSAAQNKNATSDCDVAQSIVQLGILLPEIFRCSLDPVNEKSPESHRLADFDDAGHSYDWGLFLPLGKFIGLSMNCVGASKPLPVFVKHCHLPVMVFSPLVFRE
jgi:hypothetical protein